MNLQSLAMLRCCRSTRHRRCGDRRHPANPMESCHVLPAAGNCNRVAEATAERVDLRIVYSSRRLRYPWCGLDALALSMPHQLGLHLCTLAL